MSDINLLPKNNGYSLRQEQAVAMFRRVAIVLLAATAFTSVMVFILVLTSPLSKAKQEEQDLIATLSKSSTRISRNVIIQERLASIDSILKTRNKYEKDMEVLLTALPKTVTITALDITTNTIQLTGSATSLDGANTFFFQPCYTPK